jgi:acylphosphatase
VIHGHVQGVFFRDSLRRRAQEEGVTGWARHTSEGTLEAVFEGSPEAVTRLLAWARSGPPEARVEKLDQFEEEPEGVAGFEIR